MATKKEMERLMRLGKPFKFKVKSGGEFTAAEVKKVDDQLALIELKEPVGKNFDGFFYHRGIIKITPL